MPLQILQVSSLGAGLVPPEVRPSLAGVRVKVFDVLLLFPRLLGATLAQSAAETTSNKGIIKNPYCKVSP